MERRVEILNQQPLVILRQPRKRSVLFYFFYFFLLLFVVGFVCVFRSITSMAEPTEEEEEEVKAERINRQCNLQRRVFLHVK